MPASAASLAQTLGLMTIATSVLALLLSLASLAFSVYQYRILHRVRVSEKATALLRLAYDLRRKSEDLEHKIESTDDVDDHAEFIAKINTRVETHATSIATSKKTSLATLVEVEQTLLLLELELDLLLKQVVEVGRFNTEVREHEAAQCKRNEA